MLTDFKNSFNFRLSGCVTKSSLKIPPHLKRVATYDIFNDLDGPITRFSRSRHFWSRISQKLRDKVIKEH